MAQKSNRKSGDTPPKLRTAEPQESAPPEVIVDALQKQLQAALAAEILERIQANTWQFFERLVIDVLKAMGYGGVGNDAQAFQRGSDGGIDGFINQDPLGLDVVLVQAKRWADATVGRPDVQQFVGALAGRQASKGIYITTSRFSTDARDYVKGLNTRVILVDGAQLAQLMIRYNIGVSVWQRFEIKRVDSDFFAED